MKIAFASGKGGAGKTTVSVNLARILSNIRSLQFIDCDVEEPNGHLFLKPSIRHSVHVNIRVPLIDEKKCNNCGECARFCAYKAIASLPKVTLIFDDLCHSCGGCKLLCPEQAITEVDRKIGIIERGDSGGIDFIHGRLDVGKAMSSPLIHALEKYINDDCLVIMDSPPGANCATMSSLKIADRIILVAEPTPFGLNDLKIIVDMVKELKKPFSVIINRYGMGNDKLEEWCLDNNIRITGKIPNDPVIARLYSDGHILVNSSQEYKRIFEDIAAEILREVQP
jgi:MinD superfamily P-loop ATPase